MSIFASVVASVTASPIFASASVQSVLTALGLGGATAGGQVLALGLMAVISTAALAFVGYFVVTKSVELWNSKNKNDEDNNHSDSEDESEDESEEESEKVKEPSLANKKSRVQALHDLVDYFINVLKQEIQASEGANGEYNKECKDNLKIMKKVKTLLNTILLEGIAFDGDIPAFAIGNWSEFEENETDIVEDITAFRKKIIEAQAERAPKAPPQVCEKKCKHNGWEIVEEVGDESDYEYEYSCNEDSSDVYRRKK